MYKAISSIIFIIATIGMAYLGVTNQGNSIVAALYVAWALGFYLSWLEHRMFYHHRETDRRLRTVERTLQQLGRDQIDLIDAVRELTFINTQQTEVIKSAHLLLEKSTR